MSLQSVRNDAFNLTTSLGRAGLHHLFPDDFEYYLLAFELVRQGADDSETPEDFLIFPVMPNMISQVNSTLTSIKKTANGVVSLSTPTFVPLDINISGSFGRKFRILLGDQILDPSSNNGKLSNKLKKEGQKIPFNPKIKTGYGVTKILESMFNKATALDADNGTYKMYMYNLSLNANYLVEPLNLTLSQSLENNMMWNYSMSLKAVAPLDQIVEKVRTRIAKLLAIDNLSKGVNKVVGFAIDQESLLRNKLLSKQDSSKQNSSSNQRSDISKANKTINPMISYKSKVNGLTETVKLINQQYDKLTTDSIYSTQSLVINEMGTYINTLSSLVNTIKNQSDEGDISSLITQAKSINNSLNSYMSATILPLYNANAIFKTKAQSLISNTLFLSNSLITTS